jgi:hypothetical protein
VVSTIDNLSSFSTNSLSSNLHGVTFKQFKRTYPGNYSFNFAKCLSASNDFKVKNYTNFYLTNDYKISDVLNVDSEALKAENVYGPLVFGGNYLSFEEIDPSPYSYAGKYQDHFNYGLGKFVLSPSETTNFTVKFFGDNECNIYYTKNYKKYYLCLDVDNNLVFVKETKLSFANDVINPQDFIYLFSEDSNYILFFKQTKTGIFLISKDGEILSIIKLIADNIETYLNNKFQISKNIYSYPNISLNTDFITYNNDNTINFDKSQFDLSNNLLLHKKYSYLDSLTDIIVLKNQHLQNDVFSCANNLISALDGTLEVNGLREYSSIANDIKEEQTEELELNYVFYNTPYVIKSGYNTFTSPSSILPFTKLNINDTKFVSSGAFSYITPEYADKIYHLSNNNQNNVNGQYLLCTWLSGSPFSENKVWVDRYYYPDLIEKSAALAGKPKFYPTYEDYIEQLIINNTTDNVAVVKFFDKKSDLAFEANQHYAYDRVSTTSLPSLSSSFGYCNSYSSTYPSNYFKQINQSGEMTLGFNFLGNETEWILQSDRNDIPSGLTIVKTATDITVTYNIYDTTTFEYNPPDDIYWNRYSVTSNIKQLKSNFICFSINTKTGDGYCFLNNDVILTFKLPIYEYFTKQLIYGDFFIYENSSRSNILSYTSNQISHIFITDSYIQSELAYTIEITNGNIKIDDIYITLPCGMRNSGDNLEFINNIWKTSSFKSNYINVKVKNLNVTNTDVLKGVEESIRNNIAASLPANITLNNIDFETYK